MKTLSYTAKINCLLLPPIVAHAITHPAFYRRPAPAIAWLYFLACIGTAMVGLPWAWRRRRLRRQAVRHLISSQSKVIVDNQARQASLRIATGVSKLLLQAPRNEVFEIEQNEKQFRLPRLPVSLDGFSIAHLSDLHFTGQISQSYFVTAIERVNQMEPDIVAITGDVIDNAACLPWIPDVLGRLRAKHGVYAILGNHDCKTSPVATRAALRGAGLTALNGQMHRLSINDVDVYLASNELPWLTPATDMSTCPPRDTNSQFRILLAHSPDMLPWARRFDFDLMLAGHTHGGQFCLPGFGPFVCPCRLPLEFASGTIHAPPTLLHVSRGLSAELPLRWNCRPEITRLVLRSLVANAPPSDATKSHELEPIELEPALA